MSDSRSSEYVPLFGKSSWELDALEPRVMQNLILSKVKRYRNNHIYNETMEKERGYKQILQDMADEWNDNE